MRILWVSHSAARGGAELALAEGVEALAGHGCTVHVSLPTSGPLERYLSAAASVHILPQVRWATTSAISPASRMRQIAHELLVGSRRLGELARSLKCDVIVSNTLTFPTGAFAAGRVRIPHVWFVHEFGGLDHGLTFHLGELATGRLIGALSSVVLVNSAAVGRHLRAMIAPERIRRAAYAVCVERSGSARIPGSGRGLRLAVVGQRAASKGQADAVLAMVRLRAAGLDVQLDLVGGQEPEYDRHLRRLVADHGLQNDVTFSAFTETPFTVMEQADVMLVCSPHEAFGRVTVEGMKLGRVVVGAEGGATPELIHPDDTGLLYHAGDNVHLASRIEALYADRRRCATLASRGQAWAEQRFGLGQYARDLRAALSLALCREGQ